MSVLKKVAEVHKVDLSNLESSSCAQNIRDYTDLFENIFAKILNRLPKAAVNLVRDFIKNKELSTELFLKSFYDVCFFPHNPGSVEKYAKALKSKLEPSQK